MQALTAQEVQLAWHRKRMIDSLSNACAGAGNGIGSMLGYGFDLSNGALRNVASIFTRKSR